MMCDVDLFLFLYVLLLPPIPTLFPYTTLFRSLRADRETEQLVSETDAEERHADAEERAYCTDGVIARRRIDRKSTRLNSSHLVISYAVFCLKKKNVKRYLNTFNDASKTSTIDI